MTHLPLLGWEEKEAILQAAADLDAAADFLDNNPWGKYSYREYLGKDDSGNDSYCYCAQGAIRAVTWESWTAPLPADYLRDGTAGGLFYRVTGEFLPNYNDAPGRTKVQVQAKLREVAHMARLKVGKEENRAPQP